MSVAKMKKRMRAAQAILGEVVDAAVDEKEKVAAVSRLTEFRDEVEGAIVYLRTKLDDDRKRLKIEIQKWEHRG